MAGEEIVTEALGWDELWDVVEPYMRVWDGDGERLWGAYAWGVLTRAGLTGWTTEADRTYSVLRGLALAGLSRDFYVRAFDEGDENEDWDDDISTDVIGERPRIDAFTLGQLAERRGIEADNTRWNEEEGEIADVVRVLARKEYRTVAKLRHCAVSDARLFASLWAVRDPEPGYPVVDAYVSQVVNDITGDKIRAWQWLTDELPEP